MTKAMPFLQKVILLSYDPRLFGGGLFCRPEKAQGRLMLRLSARAATASTSSSTSGAA